VGGLIFVANPTHPWLDFISVSLQRRATIDFDLFYLDFATKKPYFATFS
jgi:hypothetical protein